MIGFLTGLVEVSDPDRERREKQAQVTADLKELEAILSETRPLVLTTEGREVVLDKVRVLLDKG